jgi:hypothetical protein
VYAFADDVVLVDESREGVYIKLSYGVPQSQKVLELAGPKPSI